MTALLITIISQATTVIVNNTNVRDLILLSAVAGSVLTTENIDFTDKGVIIIGIIKQ